MDNEVKVGFDSRFQKLFHRSSPILIKGGAHFATEEARNQVCDTILSWWMRPDSKVGSKASTLLSAESPSNKIVIGNY
jgi:hypothetical protein